MAPRLSRLFGVVVFPLLRFFGFLLVDGLFLPFGAFPTGWWLVLFDHLRLTISASGSRYGRGLMQRPNSAALQKSVKSARRLLHIDPAKAPKCSFATPPGGAEKSRRAAPDTLRGRAEEGAGDTHVVVVGRADVHHQVGGCAQPVPAAEGVASPRHQGARQRRSGSWRSPPAWAGPAPGSFATPFGGTVKYMLAVLQAPWSPVQGGEEELSAGRQVVGAHDVPGVHRQGQGVAVHAHCARGVRGQDHAAAAAGHHLVGPSVRAESRILSKVSVWSLLSTENERNLRLRHPLAD